MRWGDRRRRSGRSGRRGALFVGVWLKFFGGMWRILDGGNGRVGRSCCAS